MRNILYTQTRVYTKIVSISALLEHADHRVITIIEPQRLVVLGSTARFTMVAQLRIHNDREEGWDNLLF